MTLTIQTRPTFCISAIAASPAASLAILSIASILGIGPRQAADHLASLPTVLADNLAASEAQRLSVLLTALGLTVRLDPNFSSFGAGCQPRRLDLALQPTARPTARLLARLSARLSRPLENLRAALATAEGLVLHGLSDDEVAGFCADLRRERSIRLLATDPESAVYDLFADPAVPVVRQEVARLGLAPCAFSGAVGAGLNRPTATYLARRLAGQATILNRDFQRFDLYLAIPSLPVPDEFADFLVMRRKSDLQLDDTVQDRTPRRIETDLSRPTALLFAADYAQIGLTVEARIRGARG